jgi:type II secretory pathway pseudopilin PulG
VTAINVKYLGKYIKWESGQVKAMRFYLEYINHLGRLQKKSAHRRLQAGFTITEVLLAALMMLIAVSVAGIGLIDLLRSNYRANADSEIRNNLNRTLEFVSDEVRRARIIAQTEAAIVTTEVSDWKKIPGAQAVLAFQIPNPSNPNNLLVQQIVYYTRKPENSLTGLRVLWRYGPDLDANGNYVIGNYIHSPVTDMLEAPAPAVNLDCPANFNRIPAKTYDLGGFFACVGADGNQVILNANAQVNMTTNEKVEYSVSTRVFTRACQTFCLTSPTPTTPPTTTPTTTPTPTSPPYYVDSGGGTKRPLTIPVLTVAATVKAKVIQGKPCTFSTSCGVAAAPQLDLPTQQPEKDFGLDVDANAFDNIVVFVDGLRNDETATQTLVYTSDTSLPSGSKISALTNNQILFVLTSKTDSSTSYQILLTITPKPN